ncbi:MAG: biotin-dependent carboxyltransferase family protein [Herpetosiphon sp.]
MINVLYSFFTTVQDLGRPTHRSVGVPLGGAMDRFALAAANLLVGNPAGAAALEITVGATAFEFRTPTVFAISGADLGATLDGRPVISWASTYARAGAQLEFSGRIATWGSRAYLALNGGIDVPLVLGSCSTYIPGGFGGYMGRALRAGDIITVQSVTIDPYLLAGRTWPSDQRPGYAAAPQLRILPGPHLHLLPPDTLQSLCGVPLTLQPASNRMGLPLAGVTLHYDTHISIASHGVIPGTIQLPPGGAPILLMADCQATGGYPIAAAVISADLPLAAQQQGGDTISFLLTTEELAVASRRAQAGWLAALPMREEAVELAAWAQALP